MENTNRAELRNLLSRVQSLLHDEHFHPGLMTWQMAYKNSVENLLLFFGQTLDTDPKCETCGEVLIPVPQGSSQYHKRTGKVQCDDDY